MSFRSLFGRKTAPRQHSPEPVTSPPPPVILSAEDHEKLALLLRLVNERSEPNLNRLMEKIRDLDIMALNLKATGYQLARRLMSALPHGEPTQARHVGLSWKPCTQSDMESDWVRHWCNELKTPLVFHRKLWELAYVLQALHEAGHLADGRRGLGFGCGREPIPSYLASRGAQITITDLAPEDMRAAGWSNSDEYTRTLDHAHFDYLIDRETFDDRVTLRHVDMNDIPNDLVGYDFCWSVCALEHLGSIQKGLDFIENSLKTLRPGGIAVHTLEYNVSPDGPTIDNWVTVLFQRKHIEDIARRLEDKGHKVAVLDFDTGSDLMDQFIDLPPWPWEDGRLKEPASHLGGSLQLKVAIDGFACTCFALTVTKAS